MSLIKVFFNFFLLAGVVLSPYDLHGMEDIRGTMQELIHLQEIRERNTQIDFSSLFPGVMEFRDVNFNIKGLTVISNTNQKIRPGLAPDWGIKIFCNVHFENIKFVNCRFNFLNLAFTSFKNVTFENCDFEGVSFKYATLENVQFINSKLTDAAFNYASLSDVVMSHSDVQYASFFEAKLYRVDFNESDLNGVNFFGSNIDLEPEARPVVLISWNVAEAGPTGAKVIEQLKGYDAVPFKFDYGTEEIDYAALKVEVDTILQEISGQSLGEAFSIAKRMLHYATENSDRFPVLGKIQALTDAVVRHVDGVIVPGGQDIQPQFYGAAPHFRTILSNDYRRDVLEFAILDAAERYKTPILGICRGSQVINVWRGGTLNQHINGYSYAVHGFELMGESILKDIFQKDEFLSGFAIQHQASDKIGNGLRVTARSEGTGIVQGLEGSWEDHFYMAVQFHPEFRENIKDGKYSTVEAGQLSERLSPSNTLIYSRFVEESKKFKNNS